MNASMLLPCVFACSHSSHVMLLTGEPAGAGGWSGGKAVTVGHDRHHHVGLGNLLLRHG